MTTSTSHGDGAEPLECAAPQAPCDSAVESGSVHGGSGSEKETPWGFGAGLSVGALLTLAALGVGAPEGARLALDGVTASESATGLVEWVALNLGHSFWFFALVLVLYGMNLQQLHRLLRVDLQSRRVAELDQLSDVWVHVFVGIGVIWTAVGMRSALQAALGSDGGEVIADTADSVLRKLVDGGILLALTTTIVGGVGGYLMRLCKTILLGARLQSVYEYQQRGDVQALVAATQRIESRLLASQRASGAARMSGSDHVPTS